MANQPGWIPPMKTTVGGFNTATVYSGGPAPGINACPGAVAAGADILLYSGAGRLDSVVIHSDTRSGLHNGITFYDGAAATSGGPVYASGHKILGVTLQFLNLVNGLPSSGITSVMSYPWSNGGVLNFGVPFQSGLCVSTTSGQPAFTVCWTPERPNQ